MTPAITLDRARLAARLVGWTRIGFGAGFVLAPGRFARPWIGLPATAAGGKVMTRSMGVRDALLGVGLLRAVSAADDKSSAQWLAYGSAAGVVDSFATVAAWRSLSVTGRAFLAFIGSAMLGDAALAYVLATSPAAPDGPARVGD